MNQVSTWAGLVDLLRFETAISSSDLSRDISSYVGKAKQASEPQLVKQHVDALIKLMLIKLALKEAFFPDEELLERKFIWPDYEGPLRSLGIWNDTQPMPPDKVSAQMVQDLSELVENYTRPEPEPAYLTLAEVAGIPPSRSARLSRVEQVFGPDNAYSLTQEGNLPYTVYSWKRL